MKSLKKLSIVALASLMVLGVVSMPTTTVSAETRVAISCPGCGNTLQEDPGYGICFRPAINKPGICQANARSWSCKKCSKLWLICAAGHSSF